MWFRGQENSKYPDFWIFVRTGKYQIFRGIFYLPIWCELSQVNCHLVVTGLAVSLIQAVYSVLLHGVVPILHLAAVVAVM